MQEADQERNDMYSLASDLNAYLEKMEISLHNVVDEFNETRGIDLCIHSCIHTCMRQFDGSLCICINI